MNSNKKTKYLLKNIGILTISNFASKIMVFLLVPLYTSILSTTEYGIYDLVVSTVTLLFPILSLNITDGVMRFSMDKEKKIDEIASIGIKHLFISFIPVGLFLLASFRFNLLESIQGIEIFIFLYFVSYASNQFLLQFSKGLERVSDMGIAGVLGTAALIVSNIVFLIVLKRGLIGFFIANILAQAIPSMYFLFRLRVWKYITKFNNAELRREMHEYSLPLIFSVIGWWVNNAADKFVVTFMVGTDANGILSVAYKIPSILNVLQAIFIQAWQISAIKEYKEDKAEKFYGKMFTYINLLMVCGCAFLIIMSKQIANILYAKNFFMAWQYVPFLLIASVLNSASGFLGPILSAAKDSKNMARSAVYGSIANVTMNIIFVYFIGVQGAVMATAISSLIIFIVRKLAVGSKIVIHRKWKTYTGWCILCVQAFFSIFELGYWIQIICITANVILYFEEIGSFAKQIRKTVREGCNKKA